MPNVDLRQDFEDTENQVSEVSTPHFSCLKIEVEQGLGRFYQAAVDLPLSGTFVLQETCLALALFDSHKKRACVACLARSDKQFTVHCHGCSQVYYCSDVCQESHSVKHAIICSCLRKLATMSALSGHEKSILKMVLVILTTSDSVVVDALEELESHHSDWDSDEKAGWRKGIVFVQNALSTCCSTVFSQEEIGHWISRVESNSFGIWWNDRTCIGRLLCRSASFFNHSCDPNVHAVQDGMQMSFETVRPIALGEPCTISYINANLPLSNRRKMLKQEYFFHCCCGRCVNEEKSGACAPQSYAQKHIHVKKGPPKKKKLQPKGFIYEHFAELKL